MACPPDIFQVILVSPHMGLGTLEQMWPRVGLIVYIGFLNMITLGFKNVSRMVQSGPDTFVHKMHAIWYVMNFGMGCSKALFCGFVRFALRYFPISSACILK